MSMIKNPLSSYKANKLYDEIHALFIRDIFDEATQKWEELLELYPQHTKTHLLLATIQANRWHHQAARDRYNQILSYAMNKEALLWRADSAYTLEQYEEALEDYLTLYEKSLSSTRYLIALWNTYHALWLEKISLRYHTMAVKQSSADIDANLWLAQQLLNMGQYKEARWYTAVAKDSYYKNKKKLSRDVLVQIQSIEKNIDKAVKQHAKKHKS